MKRTHETAGRNLCCAGTALSPHPGAYRCERTKYSRVVFETRIILDCDHRTCSGHSHVVDGLRLCDGCDAERKGK